MRPSLKLFFLIMFVFISAVSESALATEFDVAFGLQPENHGTFTFTGIHTETVNNVLQYNGSINKYNTGIAFYTEGDSALHSCGKGCLPNGVSEEIRYRPTNTRIESGTYYGAVSFLIGTETCELLENGGKLCSTESEKFDDPITFTVRDVNFTITPERTDVYVTKGFKSDPVTLTVGTAGNEGTGKLYFTVTSSGMTTEYEDFPVEDRTRVLENGESGKVRLTIQNNTLAPGSTKNYTYSLGSGFTSGKATLTLHSLMPSVQVNPSSVVLEVTQGLAPEPVDVTFTASGNMGEGEVGFNFTSYPNFAGLKGYDDFPRCTYGFCLKEGQSAVLQASSWEYWSREKKNYSGYFKVLLNGELVSIPVQLKVKEPVIVSNPASIQKTDQDLLEEDFVDITVSNNGNTGEGKLYYDIGVEFTDPSDSPEWMKIEDIGEFPRSDRKYALADGEQGTVKLKFLPQGLGKGTYKGNVVIKSGDAIKKVPVTLKIGTCELDLFIEDSVIYPKKIRHIPVEKTKTTIIAQLKRDAPPDGCSYDIAVEPELQSGYHKHHKPNDGRPKGTVSQSNVSFKPGKHELIPIIFESSDVSGKEKITFKDKDGKVVEEPIIKIMVPDLTPLPDGANLIKIHTTEHAAKQHDLQYANYGTVHAVLSVLEAVKQYAKEQKLPPEVNLAAIDMSLKWGGRYDANGDWGPPHQYHRRGTMVDFSKYYRDDNGNTTYGPEWLDGVIIGQTSIIDDDKLDDYFKGLFDNKCPRAEKNIGFIHYNCPK